MQGKIIKGIAGFYYVNVVEFGVYECKAKGIFRKEKQKPLVGDNVEIEVLDEETMTGNITALLPRKNELIRPAVANIDQALVVFAVTRPSPHFNLLDRFLVMMERQDIPVVVCLPLSILLLISPVSIFASGLRILIRDDFPTPEGPAMTVVFPFSSFFIFSIFLSSSALVNTHGYKQ